MINPQVLTNTPAAVRSDSAAPAAKAGAPTDQFGTVLAKKMEDKPAQKPADKAKPADPQNTGNQDAPAAPDPATFASMMFGIAKPAITPQPNLKEQDKAQPAALPDTLPTDAAAMAAGMLGVQAQGQIQTQAGSSASAKAAHAAVGATTQKTAPGALRENPSAAAMPKAEVALQAAPKLGAEMLKQVDLSAPMNTLSEQALAQSANTLVATSLPPDRTANSAVSNTTISAPVGSSAWPAEFAQKVNWVSTQQNQVAELHLNPPDLGPMTVVLSVSDNQATAVFSSPHSAVRDAIENAMPRLRESMAENGISLGNTSVNDQAPRDNQAAEQRSGSTRSIGSADADSGAAPAVSLPTMPTRRHNGMVDTFA